MTSGAAAASADLDSLYRDLRAAHLYPLRQIERDLLTDHLDGLRLGAMELRVR